MGATVLLYQSAFSAPFEAPTRSCAVILSEEP